MSCRRTPVVERTILGGSCGELSECVRSEPTPVCRDEMEIASAWVRDVVVNTEELLDFLVSWGLNILETLDVDEIMLDVSPRSFELAVVRRLVARRRKLATPEVTELLERTEGERWSSTWKFDNGRDVAGIVGQGWGRVDKSTGFCSRLPSCAEPFPRIRGRATGTTEASVGTAVLLASLSNRFCRRRRYSSSLKETIRTL